MSDSSPISLHPDPTAGLFPVSFEQVEAIWSDWPRMFFEPDGSFVWVAEDQSWQLDGVVYDRDDRVLRVDLTGDYRAAPLEQLVRTLGWPDAQLRVEQVQAGKFVELADFLGELNA
ncbi:hypothetical protein [Blastopirellula retiformator]|uniref:Uncharacterized protein n=1 Tax=Blastopirellula retiformator TaxID=2527970 RepID=A0A5C5VK91_9BACT|nr:hypothetical protein [Blastopirellula retiformator]TWT38481.1 hypothetical protein Enr8_01730 [Blastopirellula retiformator]